MKPIALLIFVLFAVQSYAQEVDFRYSQVLGKQNRTDTLYRTSIRFGIPFEIKGFTIRPFGYWETWAAWVDGENKSNAVPFQDTYGMGVDLEYRGFYIEYSHYCTHAVMSPAKYDERYPTVESWDTKMSTVSVGYRMRFHTFKIW